VPDFGGLIIAAPASGSGKTTITLGLLRALQKRGVPVRGAKSGPDYIDPQFHAAVTHRPCVNLDAWAMKPERIQSLATGPGLLVVEGAMGLFDGAPPDGRGSTADLAQILGLPVVLVIDVGKMAGSVAAIATGFMNYNKDISVEAIVLNNVGSPRHEAMLRRALSPTGLQVLGAVPRQPDLAHPSRHLGLVQASERPDLETFLTRAGEMAETALDIEALLALAATSCLSPAPKQRPTAPAQRIAIAQDIAFAFTYPHLLADWRQAGAEISFFSPLADQPAPAADLIYLPGGYPELHAGQIATATVFLHSLQNAAQHTDIYGECGGYMVLGQGLTDAAGQRHQMAGLLDLETSFETRKLQLGYRNLKVGLGPFQGRWKGHEFHYATTISAKGAPLFTASDAENTPLPPMGLIKGKVSGSFAHLIDRA
jgi:cobyrinic acid a,c-diamide synthase